MDKIDDELPEQPILNSERIHDGMAYVSPRDLSNGKNAKPEGEQSEGKNTVPREDVSNNNKGQGSSPPKKQLPITPKSGEDIDFIKYLSIVLRRKRIIFISILAFAFLGFLKNIGKVDLYEAETKLLVQLRQQNPVGQFDPGYFWDRQTKINTILNTIKSREVMRRILDKLHKNMNVNALAAAYNVKRIQETNIIRIGAVSSSPEEAAQLANALAGVYIDFNNEIDRKDIADGLSYIQKQIAKTERELREKEEILKDFQEHSKIIESAEVSNAQVEKLSELEAALQNTSLQIVENDEKINQLKKLLMQMKVYVEESFTFDNSLESKLIQLNIELAQAQAQFGENTWKVKNLKESIKQMTDLVKKNREGAVKITSTKSLNQNRTNVLQEFNNLMVENNALKAKKIAYDRVIDEMNRKITEIPTVQLQYRRLKRDKENIEAIYQLLQTKYQEQRIRYEMQTADIVQWEEAVPPKVPIQQGSRFAFLVIVLVGFAVGTAMAFVIEFFDQTVKSPQSVEEELGLPLLGIIPLMEEDSKVIDNESKSSVLEPYRSLRTNIRYTNMGAPKRSLLITSAIQGDGKTTKVCNLAISFAMEGKRVMVVDGDLRRASLHKILGVPKEMGLSEFLTGQASLSEISKKVFGGMITVITSGKRPPNPAELLGSPRFLDLLSEGLATHDMVLVDSPALVPVSDALLLAPHVDSTIIIGRAMKTPVKAMHFAKNALSRAGANLIGIVFNGIEQRKGYYPYYYHYYSYYSYYKSKYYYYEDDAELEKLPKNFKEFVWFSLKHLWLEIKSNIRNGKDRIRHMVQSSGVVTRHGKKVFMLLILLTLLVLLILGYLLFHRNQEKRDAGFPGQFRYVPYSISTAPGEESNSQFDQHMNSTAFPADTVKIVSEVTRLLDEWLIAWQDRDLFLYQKFYSMQGFRYKYGGFNEWVAYKDSLFKADSQSVVKIDSLRFESIQDTVVLAVFRQEYSANLDALPVIVKKEMKLIREGGGWKISREEMTE